MEPSSAFCWGFLWVILLISIGGCKDVFFGEREQSAPAKRSSAVPTPKSDSGQKPVSRHRQMALKQRSHTHVPKSEVSTSKAYPSIQKLRRALAPYCQGQRTSPGCKAAFKAMYSCLRIHNAAFVKCLSVTCKAALLAGSPVRCNGLGSIEHSSKRRRLRTGLSDIPEAIKFRIYLISKMRRDCGLPVILGTAAYRKWYNREKAKSGYLKRRLALYKQYRKEGRCPNGKGAYSDEAKPFRTLMRKFNQYRKKCGMNALTTRYQLYKWYQEERNHPGNLQAYVAVYARHAKHQGCPQPRRLVQEVKVLRAQFAPPKKCELNIQGGKFIMVSGQWLQKTHFTFDCNEKLREKVLSMLKHQQKEDKDVVAWHFECIGTYKKRDFARGKYNAHQHGLYWNAYRRSDTCYKAVRKLYPHAVITQRVKLGRMQISGFLVRIYPHYRQSAPVVTDRPASRPTSRPTRR